jgi:hypothetical protein
MGLATPNFFDVAWDAAQSDYSFIQGYQSDMESYSNYAPQLQQRQAENNPLDYFSTKQEHFASQQKSFPNAYGSPVFHSNDDLDKILGSFDSPSMLDRGTLATRPRSILSPNVQMQGITSYGAPPVYRAVDLGNPTENAWKSTSQRGSSPTRPKNGVTNDPGMRTYLRYGQTTPVDSPSEESLPTARNHGKTAMSKNKLDETALPDAPPKVKRRRKSKKKALTKEQEEAKRKKFLERNRIAADKCRQNRKKWIDDLQMKAHKWSYDNAQSKATIQSLKEELAMLKSQAFLHSRECNKHGLITWVEQESSRVQQCGRAQAERRNDDVISMYSQGSQDSSSSTRRPSSSPGCESISDAVSRR